jgi:hypothetical protein
MPKNWTNTERLKAISEVTVQAIQERDYSLGVINMIREIAVAPPDSLNANKAWLARAGVKL